MDKNFVVAICANGKWKHHYFDILTDAENMFASVFATTRKMGYPMTLESCKPKKRLAANWDD